eukprot:344549_1
MSHEAKEEKTKDDNSEKWELFYWKLRNRGNWIRYLFEEANVEYIDHSVLGTNIKGYFQAFSDGNQNPINATYPSFAPPAIRKGNLFLNQSEVIINYLAKELNLLPSNGDKDNNLQILQSQILLANCNDIVREVYGLRGKNKDDMVKFFEGGRLQKWLNIIEIPLLQNNIDNNEIYYFNNKCSYIDLIVFNTIEGLQALINKKFDKYMESHKVLMKHFKCIGNRDAIKKLLNKQKQELKFKWYSGRSFEQMGQNMEFV